MRDERGENALRPAAWTGGAFSRLSSLVLCLAVACNPNTTRPDITPIPEARTIEVRLSRQGAITKLHQALLADSFPIEHVNTQDAWLETPWFDALTLKATPAQRLGPDVVKLRAWADPARPGNSLLIVELVQRPLADPSVPQRELDRAVPPLDSIYVRVGTLLNALDDEIGFHGAGATKH